MNYKLKIQYNGTSYAGWQIQENAITIQHKITDVIEIITGRRVNLIGSGRTDTGVHALGQIANFRIDNPLDLYKFKYQMNSVLPKDISVLEIVETSEDFNARFDAKKRTYLYVITRYKSPFLDLFSYNYHGDLNLYKLIEISKIFRGTKDFTSFSKRNFEIENTVCSVYDMYWRESKNIILAFIKADRFLHGMVRSIVGTSLLAVKKNLNEQDIENIFLSKNREAAGESVPAKGLFLYKVQY